MALFSQSAQHIQASYLLLISVDELVAYTGKSFDFEANLDFLAHGFIQTEYHHLVPCYPMHWSRPLLRSWKYFLALAIWLTIRTSHDLGSLLFRSSRVSTLALLKREKYRRTENSPAFAWLSKYG